MSSLYFSTNTNAAPFNNIVGNLVNKDASNWPGGFSSTETSLQFGLPNAFRNNVAAANASLIQKGGKKKTLRRKIKNIANKYRMPKSKRNSVKRRLLKSLKGGFVAKYKVGKGKKNRSSSSSSSSSSTVSHVVGRGQRKTKKSRKQSGGTYHQYGSQIPNTPSFRTPGFPVGANDIALANPAPFAKNTITGSCTDNYNHYKNSGYQFW